MIKVKGVAEGSMMLKCKYPKCKFLGKGYGEAGDHTEKTGHKNFKWIYIKNRNKQTTLF